MNVQNIAPCVEWAEQLACLHPGDLSPAERSAQEAHLASCPACSTIRKRSERLSWWYYPRLRTFFTIHQSVIYMNGGSGKVLALRSDTGTLLRSYTIGDGSGRMLTAPVVAEDMLYDSDSNTFYALRVRDGSVVWHTTLADNFAISSFVDHQVYALRASNGQILWHYQTPGMNEEPGVIIAAHGITYISSYEGNIQHLYAVNTKNGGLLWSRQFSEKNGPDLLVNNGMIFVFAGNGLFALRAESGTPLWTYRAENASTLETPTIANGLLYTLGDNGYLYALQIERGKLQWSSKIADDASSTSPLLLINGTLLTANFSEISQTGNNSKRAGGNLYALDMESGHLIWQKNFGFNDIPYMAVDHGTVYITSTVEPNEMLSALRLEDGSILWSKSLNGL